MKRALIEKCLRCCASQCKETGQTLLKHDADADAATVLPRKDQAGTREKFRPKEAEGGLPASIEERAVPSCSWVAVCPAQETPRSAFFSQECNDGLT